MTAAPRVQAAPTGRRSALARLAMLPLAFGMAADRVAAQPRPQAFALQLKRGFNLAHWFEYERTQPLTRAELAGLKAVGLDHVRLPVDPMVLGWKPTAPQALPFLAELRAAADDAMAAGLEVVVDLHFTPEHKAVLERDTRYEPALIALWSALARGLSDTPTSQLGLELFNEPQYYGLAAMRWPPLLRRLVAAVREQAPRHGLLVSGNRGGSLEALLEMAPIGDAQAAYTFHYYDPFVFTHQALPWLDDRYTAAGSRADVLYPAREHEGRPPRQLRAHPKADEEWQRYRSEDWRADRIAADFARAAAWGRRHGVRVLCNEFGAIRKGVDVASRHRWLGDVRSAAEQHGIGWTVWEYSHIFGLTRQSTQVGQAGRRQIEAEACRALGLACNGG